jgi:hypothetical protein
VVVQGVLEARDRDRGDHVLADDGVDEGAAPRTAVERGTGTVSPATTTEAPSCSNRKPTLGSTGRWSVGAQVMRTTARR